MPAADGGARVSGASGSAGVHVLPILVVLGLVLVVFGVVVMVFMMLCSSHGVTRASDAVVVGLW